MMTSIEELTRLVRQVPLPSSWSEPECHTETVSIGGLDLRLVGLVAHGEGPSDGVGSAAEVDCYPYRRAYYELLERVTILDAIESTQQAYDLLGVEGEFLARREASLVFPTSPVGAEWSFARSNGVAVRDDWDSACRAATAEVIERHRVLCAWFGMTLPERITGSGGPADDALLGLYELQLYRFPPESPADSSAVEVVGCFGFPTTSSHPLVYGFGAGSDVSVAGVHATRECLQRLGFLWGEQIPISEPAFEASPNYHQELFLWPAMHGRLRAWLTAGHVRRVEFPRRSAPRQLGYVDLTPGHLRKRVCVVKAVLESVLPLTFGRGYPELAEAETLFGVHPIV